MADDESQPAPDEGLDARVSSLETGQHSLSEKLDKILGIVGAGGGGEHDTEPSGGPPNVAHEIRQQLEARDKARAEADRQQSLSDKVESIAAQLAEKAPAPVPRRVEKIMGWS